MRVELAVNIEANLTRDRDHLRREGFVELDDVDVPDLHSRLVENALAGFDRPYTHDGGIDARH